MQNDAFEMRIQNLEMGPVRDGYAPVHMTTTRGTLHCRYYRVPGARRAAIWVGGAGGGWDTPAQGLYPRLCEELQALGISSLRIRFRQPSSLQEAVVDTLAGLAYLESEGIAAVALTGHSLGGAVVLQAAAQARIAHSVVTLATQSYGAGSAGSLPPGCALLVVHGAADQVLPLQCSQYVHRIAHEPKRLLVYPGAGHTLEEVAEEVHAEVHEWIVRTL